jgi:hypothetical protein
VSERTYTREEMEEIFRRAAERTSFQDEGAGAIRYEDLVAAAREVGIDPAAIEQVARSVEADRAALARKAEDDAIVAEEVKERRHRARRSLLSYAVVCTFLAVLDFLTPGGPWAYWVALIWGLFVALGLGRAMLSPSERDRRRIVRRERKRREKVERREARERAARAWKQRLVAQQEAVRKELAERAARSAQLQQASRELERSVEEGVTALLGALAKRIEDAARPPGPGAGPVGDFGAYVTREKQRGADAPGGPTSPAARVRVAEPPPGGPTPSSATAEEHDDEVAGERRARGRR